MRARSIGSFYRERGMEFIVYLFVGAVAGWLAGVVVKGGGFGLIGDIIVGIVGGLLAGWLCAHVLNFSLGGGIIGQILTSAIGAIILLLIIRLIKRG
jgi:uncharacterized membrane protein YeaQ/YmgE (transglycosylase-associated protein family)